MNLVNENDDITNDENHGVIEGGNNSDEGQGWYERRWNYLMSWEESGKW